ncbi:MAG: thioredoxin family protein [Cellvibrionales bacterium]|nr:thioredoxin family protein [Cellvibrionales bacterium]
MAMITTPPLEPGRPAPDFQLRGIDDRTWSLEQAQGPKGVVVLFICNHCPFVKAVAPTLEADARRLATAGVGLVAIMPNDTAAYPADSFENMRTFAADHGFTFPYLIDETQEVARAYGAVCTPDVFGFAAGPGGLQYRGQIDATRPNSPAPPNAPRDMAQAMLQIAKTGKGPTTQKHAAGCSIKWRPK